MKTLFVFDLDFTLWDCGGTWCDHTRPPYTEKNGKLTDRNGRHIRLYNDVKPVLSELKHQGIPLALASRTGEPEWAKELLNYFGLDSWFDYREIYPGSKLTHFRRLQEASGIDYSSMVFFDDEYENIREISSLGVKTAWVRNGFTRSDLESICVKDCSGA